MSVANLERMRGNPSGFKDTLPGEQLLFDRLRQTLTHIVERYGFSPINTPVIEWMDTLTGHDGTEGKLIYRASNGYDLTSSTDSVVKADKGLRFDLTVPLARFLTDHAHQLPKPFKRYHVGQVFRGESAAVGKGRYREFFQFDADTVGTTNPAADAETVAMLVDAMRALELPAVVKVNHRKLLDALVEVGGITDEATKTAVFTAIDKHDKIGTEAVLEQVLAATSPEFTKLVAQYLAISGSPTEILAELTFLLGKSQAGLEGIRNLKDIISLLEAAGYEGSFQIAPEIVRGLGYYTGAIFETFVEGYEEYGSVASGGRYDKLIADLGGTDAPAVGASFGLSRLLDVLQASGWKAEAQTPAVVFIAHFMPELAATYFTMATQLRSHDIPVLLGTEEQKLGNQMKGASEQGIPYAVIVGEDEQAAGTATIRDLETRKQITVEMSLLAQTLLQMLAEREDFPSQSQT